MEFLKKNESKGPLSCDTILKIFYQACRAVQHMHRQKPPIIHRDLKVPPAGPGPGGGVRLAARRPWRPVCQAAASFTVKPLRSLAFVFRRLNAEAGYGDELAGADRGHPWGWGPERTPFPASGPSAPPEAGRSRALGTAPTWAWARARAVS